MSEKDPYQIDSLPCKKCRGEGRTYYMSTDCTKCNNWPTGCEHCYFTGRAKPHKEGKPCSNCFGVGKVAKDKYCIIS